MFGQYRLMKQIASKATGRTYLAQSLVSWKKVALKTLEVAQHDMEHARFLQHAQALKELKHAHILPTLDAGIENGLPYIVAPYASRGSLYTRLKQATTGPIPGAEALEILSEIGEALCYAHDHNILHGNIKPENIVFNSRGEVLLADFNPIPPFDTPPNTIKPDTRSMCYMAPEQFDGIVSKESDQYALGCLAYELFTGRVPFSALALSTMRSKHTSEAPVAPTQLVPNIPDYIEVAILKALAKNPNDRHADVLTFIKALKSAAILFPPPSLPTANTSSTPQDATESPAVAGIQIYQPVMSRRVSEPLAVQGIQRYQPKWVTAPQQLQIRQNSGATPPIIGTMSKGKTARSQLRMQESTLWLTIATIAMVVLVVVYALQLFSLFIPQISNNQRSSQPTVLPTQGTTVSSLTLTPKPTSSVIPITMPSRMAMPTPTPKPQAALTGTFTEIASTVNLTKEGTIDWVHWGLFSATDFDHKARVASQISNYTAIGDGTVGRNTTNPTSFTWSDGTPNKTANNSATGSFIHGSDDGFSFTVQASTTMRTLKVYVGVGHVQGKFTATLSGDGAPPMYVDTTLRNTGVATGVYTINYMATTPGQHLTITFVVIDTLDTNPNVKLLAATLH